MSERDDLTWGGAVALILVIIAACGLDACWAEHVYGDYTCAWSKCVRVKP